MRVQLDVHCDITFCDELDDPMPGDSFETRFRESTREAIEEALNHAMNRGFNHDLSDSTSIYVVKVGLR